MPPAIALWFRQRICLKLLEPYYELSIAPEIMKNIMENQYDRYRL